MNRTARTILVYMVVAILVMMAVNVFLQGANEPEELSLSEFQTKLVAGDVASIEMKTRSDEIIGTFVEDAVVPGANNEFRTVYPAEFEDELTTLIDQTGLEDFVVNAENPSALQWFFGTIFPYLLIFGAVSYTHLRAHET